MGNLLFNSLSLCPQLSCMHCNINPTLLIQGMANDNANITCSSLTKVRATNSEILQPLTAPCIMLLRWLICYTILHYSALFCVILHYSVMHQSALDCTILCYSIRIHSALFCIILHYTCCQLSRSKIEMQSRWGSSSPVTHVMHGHCK